MKANKQKKEAQLLTNIEPINIHSDEEKKAAGLLWYGDPYLRDPSIWTKTPKEKARLRKAKHSNYTDFASKWAYTKHPIPCYSKLIIRLNKAKGGCNTISTLCGQSNILDIVTHYQGETNNVIWYKWLGRKYHFPELPYYFGDVLPESIS